MKFDHPSSNLDHRKGGNGMVATQNKQQVTAQSLGSYSQKVKQNWFMVLTNSCSNRPF